MTNQINLTYQKSVDYKSSLASGVYGGANSNGIIEINFFLDRFSLPSQEIVPTNVEHTMITTSGITREVQCGIFLDINSAKIISQWLKDQLDKLEATK